MFKRRIAVITARADADEQKEIICGIAEAAFYANADTVVFSNIHNHMVKDEILNYENIIYSLFEPDDFDGAIITAEAFLDISIINDVVIKLKKSKTPVVVIDGEIQGFESIYSNDESDMEVIVNHLFSHDLKRIDILTGTKGDQIAEKRGEGCKKALKKYGIQFDEDRFFYGNFWNDSGEELALRYINGELSLPQAVICTNDYMAFGLCDKLLSAGISIPEKICIIGYDYTRGRIYHHPILTTMRRNRKKLGHDAVNLLLGSNYFVEDNNRLVKGNSCLCGIDIPQFLDELSIENTSQYHTIMSTEAQFSSKLTACKTLAEYISVLSDFFYLLHNSECLYLCLDSEWGSPKFLGEEYICCKVNYNGISEFPKKFSCYATPPFFSEKCGVYFYSPICYQTRFFGYTVLKFSYPSGYDYTFRNWNKTVADTLEFLRMKNDIHYLTQCQQASSLYDSLTGFYNIREFRKMTEEMNNYTMYAVKIKFSSEDQFFYGENYRNDIISDIAKSIKSICSTNEICCRSNEDTFLILNKNCSNVFSEKLNVMIFNSLNNCDERQVVLSIAKLNDCSIEDIYNTVVKKSNFDYSLVKKRRKLIHYNFLLDLRKNLRNEPHKSISLSEASFKLCVSEGYFRSIYRECFGVSFNKDCIYFKLQKACYLLITTAMSIYAVALHCGYKDEKFFTRQFGQIKGCTPMEYRKKIADML